MSEGPSSDNPNSNDLKAEDALRKWVGIVYLLQILSLAFGGLTLIAGVIINYLKRSEVRGTWLDSHFTWQITTFWYTSVLVILGLLSFGFLLGYILLIFSAIFLVYRVFLGWGRWNINEAIEQKIF